MNILRTAGVLALFLGLGSSALSADSAVGAYPAMAPLERYLSSSQTEEIALARSAAPASISADAEILILSAKGYETAIKGKNHFVCLVVRPWDNHFDSPDFWNPKVRAPHCFNAPGARSVLPTYLQRTGWVLAGVSKAEMQKRTEAALAANKIPAPETGSIAFMMSKDGYLGDDAGGHWHPHLMFYLPRTAMVEWGANLKGSPVYGDADALKPTTVFFVPVTRWSDGTAEDK